MGGMEREASMRVESSTGNMMLERGREKIKTVGKSTRNVRGQERGNIHRRGGA